mmetsp:Transcript_4882/g.7874  ORF Transcript_4882/g.7874 Transcript_4882/m.7874 type:complete len:352 (-) Transcript_4882:93-1148(-)
MACCSKGNSDAARRDAQITNDLLQAQDEMSNEVKLLLLGAGQSGKSTVAKQMKIIHMDGFSAEERASYTSVICSNIVVSMRSILFAAREFGIKTSKTNKAAASRILSDENEYFSGTLSKEMAEDIKALWADKGVKKTYERRSEYQLNDSAAYYFDAVERIAADDYVPTEQDVLRSRAKTTGIIETEFEVGDVKFRMCDVGGQRSERKKWMHCFQDVTACIFCVALSEYNLTLYEDGTTNRMLESLKLFKEICNSKWFVDTAMIIFLNKMDLFAEKIKTVDLTCAFPEYTGGCDYDAAIQFIQEKFIAQNENPKKLLYPNVTCATDTKNIEVVFTVVQDIILRDAIDSGSLL